LSTQYAFQYGTTSAYGAESALTPVGEGSTTIKVATTLTGLVAHTAYHYRIVATSSAGTSYGKDRTFTTGTVPLSIGISSTPNPLIYGSPFFVQGSLAGTGAGGREVALQINPYPYTAGFSQFGNAEITTSSGGFSFPYVGLFANEQLRVVTIGGTEVVSSVVTEGVAPQVSFHEQRTSRRGYFRLYGTVTPSQPGVLVGFQFLRPGAASLNEGGSRTGRSGSNFSSVIKIRRPGYYEALVQVTNPEFVHGYSSAIYIP
jgi:hypothetical protein